MLVRHAVNNDSNSTFMGSPAIWHDCQWDVIGDPRSGIPGIKHYIDFSSFRTSTDINAAEAHWQDGLKVFGSLGASIAAKDAIGGGATFASDGDNEGASVGQMIYPYQISRSHKKLWFEARLQTSTIADTKHGFFVGLIDSSVLSATVPIAAAGTLADENFVGWHRLEGDGDKVDAVYKADGVTQVTVEADAGTLVADTAINLGLKWDPDNSNKLSFYVDNDEVDTYTMATADGTDFPNDVRLGFVFALLNATAATPGNTTIHWARIAQLL
jgi:hypothetical protein